MLLRKSREDEEAEREGQYETLRYHEGQLNRLAASLGISIADNDIYRELQSGEILSNCHRVMELIGQVSRGVYVGVFVVTSQRLTRGDPIDRGTILSAFTLSHTLIVTPNKIYDPTVEGDMFTLEIELLFGHRELGSITAQFAAGKINKTEEEGQYLAAQSPFGWTKCVKDRKKTLKHSDDFPTLLQWYKELAAHATTATAIATDRNRRGLLTARGAYWTANGIVRIICNPANKGYVFWGSKRVVTEYDENLRKRKRLVRVDPDEWHLTKGLHYELGVPEDLWQAAVDWVGLPRPRARKTFELKDPLAGLLRCKKCGHGMHRLHNNRNVNPERYSHARINAHECWCVGSTLPAVMEVVARSLQQITEDISIIGDDSAERKDSVESHISLLEKELKETNAGKERLYGLVVKGYMTDDEFYVQKLKLDKRIDETEKQIAILRNELEGTLGQEQRITYLKDAVAACEHYEGRIKEVNDALRRIIDHIDYTKENRGDELHLDIYIK